MTQMASEGGECIDKKALKTTTRKHLLLVLIGTVTALLFITGNIHEYIATIIIGTVFTDLMKYYGHIIYTLTNAVR